MDKLHLGCGDKYIESWINVDNNPNIKKDINHDLNKTPWPWEDNSIDEVMMIHSLEHLDNIKTFKELYRICKNGSMIYIEVPFGTNGYCCIDHKKNYDWNTFKNLGNNKDSSYLPFNFRLYNQYGKNIGIRKILPQFTLKYIGYFFPILVANLFVELEVVK